MVALRGPDQFKARLAVADNRLPVRENLLAQIVQHHLHRTALWTATERLENIVKVTVRHNATSRQLVVKRPCVRTPGCVSCRDGTGSPCLEGAASRGLNEKG